MRVYAILLGLLLASSSAYSAEVTNCAVDEKIVFSCSTGKKIVSICASKDAAKDKGYMQYRFGPTGKLELTFPETKEPANKNFSFVHELYAHGTAEIINFTKGAFSFAVAHYWDSKSGDSGTVEVTKSGKLLTTINCKTPLIYMEMDSLKALGIVEITTE